MWAYFVIKIKIMYVFKEEMLIERLLTFSAYYSSSPRAYVACLKDPDIKSLE